MSGAILSALKYMPKVADIDPQLCAASATKASSYVAAGGYRKFYAAASLGALDSGTVTLQLYQATDSGGTSAKVLGSSVASATNGAFIEVEVDVSAMDIAGGFTHVCMKLVGGSDIGGTGAYVSGVLFGVDPRFLA